MSDVGAGGGAATWGLQTVPPPKKKTSERGRRQHSIVQETEGDRKTEKEKLEHTPSVPLLSHRARGRRIIYLSPNGRLEKSSRHMRNIWRLVAPANAFVATEQGGLKLRNPRLVPGERKRRPTLCVLGGAMGQDWPHRLILWRQDAIVLPSNRRPGCNRVCSQIRADPTFVQ